MNESPTVRESLLRFYDRRSVADSSVYDDLVAHGQTIMIGTGPDEWFEDREVLRGHFGVQAFRLEPGDARAWEDGDVGWFTDTPRFVLPDGGFLATRLSGVMLKEEGAWKLALAHFSVAVPDEDAIQRPED